MGTADDSRDRAGSAPAAESIRALAETLAEAAGLDLIDVNVKGTGGRRLVRVIIDRKGGVDLAKCRELSTRLSAELDAADPIEGRYSLEVTSPGIDYPLRTRRDFDRVESRTVLIHRRSAADDTVRQVRGTVIAAEDEAVVLMAQDEELRIPYGEIAKATQELPW
jgi:ribosome maturation factor RimP